jgi:gas vesicle protein
MDNRGTSAVEVTLSFLLGTAAGFILGVLFAPASGEETRKKIQEGAVKTGEKAKDSYERVAKEAEKGIELVKEKTTEGVTAIKDFVDKKKEEISKKIPDFSAKEEEKK